MISLRSTTTNSGFYENNRVGSIAQVGGLVREGGGGVFGGGDVVSSAECGNSK